MSRIRKFAVARQEDAPATGSPTPAELRSLSLAAVNSDPIAAVMDQASADVPRLLTPQVVAEMLSLTERTLERWRITGEGPRFVKLSRSTVRYLPEDITAFIAAGLRANTAQ